MQGRWGSVRFSLIQVFSAVELGEMIPHVQHCAPLSTVWTSERRRRLRCKSVWSVPLNRQRMFTPRSHCGRRITAHASYLIGATLPQRIGGLGWAWRSWGRGTKVCVCVCVGVCVGVCVCECVWEKHDIMHL